MVAVSWTIGLFPDPRSESPPDSPDQEWSICSARPLPEDFDLERYLARLPIPRDMICLAEHDATDPSQVYIVVASSYCSLISEGELQRAHLYWDLEQSNDCVLQEFTENLLLFCLGCCGIYDTLSVLQILKWNREDWLRPFYEDIPTKMMKESEEQTISLFRSFLELSGGRVARSQHRLGMEYTTAQNASLCTSFLGVLCSRRFGHAVPEEMRGALSRSKLFEGRPSPDIERIITRSRDMMTFVPIGFPDNYMQLPSQLLFGLGAEQINTIRVYCEHIYRKLPSLREDKNNILILLIRSSSDTPLVLRDWINSEESADLYQSLIQDLWLNQTPEQLGLTLAALLCRERMITGFPDQPGSPIKGSYLKDFNSILSGQDVTDKQRVFAQMISSLSQVLWRLQVKVEAVQFLVEVLHIVLQEPLSGVADDYWVERVHEHDHETSFEKATIGFLGSVHAWFADVDLDGSTEDLGEL